MSGVFSSSIELRDYLGFIAAACTTTGVVVQAAKTIRTRETSGISLHLYIFSTVGIMLWFIYGVWERNWPLIVGNAITSVSCAAILCIKWRNRKTDEE